MSDVFAPMGKTESGELAVGAPVVIVSGLSVAYGSNTVLSDINLEFQAGRITALLGANGAGKSTLIKALSGANPQYRGSIVIDGHVAALSSPTKAKAYGISTVHQKVADGVVPGLSIAENVLLDDFAHASKSPIRNTRRMLAEARIAFEKLGVHWSDRFLQVDAGRLNISDAQMLVLARALRGRPRMLILDEPTSALTATEAERLFTVLRELKRTGLAIVYVSHRFGEIDALADSVTVLRDGVVQSTTLRPFEWSSILFDMLGRRADLKRQRTTVSRGAADLLCISGTQLFDGGAPLDLVVRSGEILGILGLTGAGKTELAETLTGLRPPLSGRIELEGEVYAPRRPSDAINRGVVLVPEDRQQQGILPGWSISHNVSLPFLRGLSRFGILRPRSEGERARGVVADLGVVTTGTHASIDDLSGGNQQKVVVGRWLSGQPKLIVLDEPFRGVDIGARRDIGDRLRSLTESGRGVIVLAGDVDEILDVADRVVVLVQGMVQLDAYLDETDEDAVVNAFLGKIGTQDLIS